MRRTYRAVAGGFAAVLLAAALGGCGDSQQSWIGKKYHKVGYNTFQASQPPRTVASAINRKFKAIDRVDDLTRYGSGGGVFLRYPKMVVGVTPSGRGSRITIDKPSGGYNRYYSHVGHLWSAPGSGGWNKHGIASFRGGGPGSGK
ncbi:DUF4247 domain-containing protein [Actinomadura opuntiae]|uniref:DUF4247 domain-containing protein n=1 Tax=Actinomadura sp. OS1-43 TaxID=604315 RepID=UPI00255AFF52|nr:DUF4247 domain-containing protein [Actinomadura sp. OS1-43]MDL4817647.1 DUF4247 domain-containing protein [Actinomadura sp. OS1-43]